MAISSQGQLDQQRLDLVNQYRSQFRLRALSLSPKLDQAADKFSNRMASGNVFNHTDLSNGSTFSSRIRAEGYRVGAGQARISQLDAIQPQTHFSNGSTVHPIAQESSTPTLHIWALAMLTMQIQPIDMIEGKHSELVIQPLEPIAPRAIPLHPRQLLPSQAPTLLAWMIT
jgi:hypothetical protein